MSTEGAQGADVEEARMRRKTTREFFLRQAKTKEQEQVGRRRRRTRQILFQPQKARWHV